MKNNSIKYLRSIVQASIFLILILIIVLYNLYISKIINFKIIGIGDLNPYGGWSTLRESLTNSSYVFQGINKSMSLSIALLTMAIIGGRFFCGWICPLGAFQDFAAYLGSKVKIVKYKYSHNKGFNPLLFKYIVLLILLMVSVLGYGALGAELSPWRALLNLPKLPSAWAEIKIGFIILAGVFLISMFISRFFCRYLCPLGAIQTLFSSLSTLSLKHSSNCTKCNICLNECPVGLKFTKESDIISPECIRCLNCVEKCKVSNESRVYLSLFNKKVSKISYILLMLILFVFLWIGLPKLWGESSYSSSIYLGNLKDGTYQGEAKGFAGKIITEVKIENRKIVEIKVIEHNESKGWYEEVYIALPKEIIKNQNPKVDGISGATKTSNGFIKSIENALKKAVDTAK